MLYTMPHNTPVIGCVVADRDQVAALLADPRSGLTQRTAAVRLGCIVRGQELRAGVPMLRVEDRDRRELWLPASRAVCAIPDQAPVQHTSVYSAQPSLGAGRVIQWRALGGREQLLVAFDDALERRWLPFEHLCSVSDLMRDTIDAHADGDDHAERLRLHVLARGLKLWHSNTGALAQLDIDPLPHQINLVHHLIRSNHLNWIIADDVGLGKTIEVGMILHQRLARSPNARILIVTPPGLVKQWQEELCERFGLDGFEIYGEELGAKNGKALARRAQVIASMDRLKQPEHRAALEQAGTWDLIVVDEAHRLTRRQYGSKYEQSDRFRLAAEVLRPRTDDLLLLTATPHQGRTDQFQALLELVRPELRDAIQNIQRDAGFLRDVLYRNRKVDVTDAEGRFIFHGQDAHAIELPSHEDEQEFDTALQRYFQDALSATTGKQHDAVGFVTTVMRKLAASSHAAILRALTSRRDRLNARLPAPAPAMEAAEAEGEQLELIVAAVPATPFFSGELVRLDRLISACEALHATDAKLAGFMGRIVGKLDADQRLLVFTEFRGTQEHLVRALTARFGMSAVAQIHGGMDLAERRAAQAAFRGEARFLVSTEAGGEGLNLHHGCHTMVNYDLPWNPMRMVQRVGRLYRYGQPKRVQVFNLYGRATVDERVVGLMYRRLDTVAQEMGGVGEEFDRERLRVEIFGELAGLMDVEALLEEGPLKSEARSAERIDAALRSAKEARVVQQDLLAGARRYDPGATADQLQLGMDHVWSFVGGMLGRLGCQIERRTHQGRVMEARLSEALARRLGQRRQHVRLTADRELERDGGDIELLTMRSPLLLELLREASDPAFGGRSARVYGLSGTLLMCAQLRWMGDRGQVGLTEVEREELLVVRIEGEVVSRNDAAVSAWLLAPATSTQRHDAREALVGAWQLAEQALDAHLGAVAHERLHPAQRHPFAAATLHGGR